MTDEELRQQRAEEERLIRQINHLQSSIEEALRENNMLQNELEFLVQAIFRIVNRAEEMDRAVNQDMGFVAGKVDNIGQSAGALFALLQELCASYFTFKSLSTASKNLTSLTDEYSTRFSNYNELRRITLGYVIGLDKHICSSDTLRKKVEKAYLQNTEYWLAYCIAATMLWASDEKEAAQRAIDKGLRMDYYKSCLYFLLVNLRFARIDAARKWYVNYLDKVDMDNPGEEWQYLLQSYLYGAFGANREFEAVVSKSFSDMLEKVQARHADFPSRVAGRANEYIGAYLHTSGAAFETLRKTCSEYQELLGLLASAEKYAVFARKFLDLLEGGQSPAEELPQRIENSLYSLISNYDAEEENVQRNIKYNEMVIQAKGDVSAAQKAHQTYYAFVGALKSIDMLLFEWAFSEDETQVSREVRRFSLAYLKDWVAAGFRKYREAVRNREKETYQITIDNCKLDCSELDCSAAEERLAGHYEKTKLRETVKDKFVLIYSGVCLASVLTLLIMAFAFSPVALVIGILLGLGGSFLLWRRLVDMSRILKDRHSAGVAQLKASLAELGQWRALLKEEDGKFSALEEALAKI